MISSRCLLFAVILASFGCRSTGVSEEGLANAQDAVCIAAVGGTDRETQKAIMSLLERHDIPCIVEGSVVYEVVVSDRDAARAKELLAETESIREKLLPFPENKKNGK